MSVTSLKQSIKEEGGGISNVSKTIEKQGLELGVGYYANYSKKGKTDVEGEGDTTCAHRWKTAYLTELQIGSSVR